MHPRILRIYSWEYVKNAIEYFTDTYNGERFFIENAINFVEQEIASTQGFLDGLKWLMEEPDKQYVYVVIKDKSVEVYGNEELAKLRAEAIDARYYKRTIHYNFSEMVALDESREKTTEDLDDKNKS